jgi:hypothetical protein
MIREKIPAPERDCENSRAACQALGFKTEFFFCGPVERSVPYETNLNFCRIYKFTSGLVGFGEKIGR